MKSTAAESGSQPACNLNSHVSAETVLVQLGTSMAVKKESVAACDAAAWPRVNGIGWTVCVGDWADSLPVEYRIDLDCVSRNMELARKAIESRLAGYIRD